MKTSNPTARQTIALLQQEGVLEEGSGRKSGQLYLARPFMRIIENPTDKK